MLMESLKNNNYREKPILKTKANKTWLNNNKIKRGATKLLQHTQLKVTTKGTKSSDKKTGIIEPARHIHSLLKKIDVARF